MLCMRPARAVEEGILPGGGVALLRAGKAIEKKLRGKNEDQRHGIEIVKKGDHLAGAPDPQSTPARGWLGRGRQDPRARYLQLTATTRRPASSAIWCPRASSTRPRLCASRCRMLPRLRAS